MNNLTLAQLKKAMAAKGYPWFSTGEYNLNLIGIRSKDLDANTFNDLICVAFHQAGNEILFQFPGTTDPGVYYRESPINVDGTAILKPGHWQGMWQVGMHQGKYRALVQRRPVTVYRDNDGNRQLNPGGNEQTGLFGINLHRASESVTSTQVDRWSAGCQVLSMPQDFALVMALVDRALVRWGNSFSYTLLEEADL